MADTNASMATPVKRKRNKYSLGCTLLANMTSSILGYDIGVMSGAAIFLQEDLKISDTKISILLGMLNIYSLVGSCAAGRTSDRIGRRYTIIVAGAMFFVGSLLMGFAPNYAMLMIGRFVAGVGVGYALMIAPVYTTEISPAPSRGFLTSFPEVFINFGILLGYVSNFAFAGLPKHLGWRLMLGIGAIPAVFLALGVLAMPESPRWLVLQGQLGKAKRVLEKILDSREEAQVRLAEIKEAAGIPETQTGDVVPMPKRSHGEGVWKELLLRPSPSVRRILIVALAIHFFQQVSGIDSVVLYSPRIFEKAGIRGKNNLLGATVGVGAVKTFSILVATFFLDKVGRRPLLLTSIGGMIFSLAFLGLGLTVIERNPHEKPMWAIVICVIMVLGMVAAFSIGLGPITWVYSSEIFPLRLRAQGVSLSVAVNRLTSGLIAMTFIPLYKAITIGGSFFLYCGIGALAWIFFYFFLPETRGRPLEDMESLFSQSMLRRGDGRGGERNDGQVQLEANGVV